MALTEGEIEIIREIETDYFGDDSEYDESEIVYPPCEACGQPATGWSEYGATCNACFERECAIDRAARIPSGEPVVYCEEVPGVGFPF